LLLDVVFQTRTTQWKADTVDSSTVLSLRASFRRGRLNIDVFDGRKMREDVRFSVES
jgi:hypothetical protein